MNWGWLGSLFRPGPTFRYRIFLLVIAVYLFVDAAHRYVISWRANFFAWRLEFLFGGLLVFAAWWLLHTENSD